MIEYFLADPFTILMALGAFGSTAFKMVSGQSQAEREAAALRQQAKYSRDMSELNASLSNMNAQDALRFGDDQADILKSDAQKMIGAQRAALAAQGIEIDSGSALQVQADTAGLASQDAMRIKANAVRQAYGFKLEGIQHQVSGAMGYTSGMNTARSTIAAGGMNAVGAGVGLIGQMANIKNGGRSNA